MKKFLIAAILVLSCSTASADDVYIIWRDQLKNSPEEHRAWRSLVDALDSHLRKAGHTSRRTNFKQETQLGIQLFTMTANGGRGRTYVDGALFCLVKDNTLNNLGMIPLNGSGFDADWMARKILQQTKLD